MGTISDLNSSAYEYIVSVIDRFNDICKPIYKLGISNFGYIKIFETGSYLNLNTNLGYNKIYLRDIRDQGSFFSQLDTSQLTKNLQQSKYHYYTIPTNIEQFDRKEDPILHLFYDWNMWNILCVYKLNNLGFVECYYFSMTRNDIHASEMYLNNLSLLKHFIDYFNEKAKDLIDTTDKRKLAYYQRQLNVHNSSKDEILTEKIKQFLEETQITRRNMQTTARSIQSKNGEIKLAPREVECLHYLARGNSTKEIARILDLSPRTIDFYLSNTKQKTGYSTRAKLVAQFMKEASADIII